LKHFLVMSVGLGAGYFASGHVQAFLIDITKRNHFHIGFDLPVLKHQAELVRAPAAYPDHSHVDTIVRSQYASPGGYGKHLCADACRFKKAASRYIA
jgi:hypothetical protein